MSYIDHGPSIFGKAKSKSGLTLSYGDYVLPRKRSEGRLKMQESCTDIRAWSSNPMENSRYLREMAEDAPIKGKVVPFNVLIDNLIKLGSQTKEELESVKRELENYKSLKLTPKQKEQLENLANNKGASEEGRSLSKIIMSTFFSNNSRGDAGSIYAENNKDVSIQVQPAVSELAVQYDSSKCESDNTSTDFTYTTSESTMRNEKSFCSVNSEFDNESENEATRLAYESQVNKAIIIEKDSKIIALENEVEAKNAELDERGEKINEMKIHVRNMKNNLEQKCCEIDDLRIRLKGFKFEKRRLQDSLDNQANVSEAQLQEINKLRFRVNKEENIRCDLISQLEQMRKRVDLLQKEVQEKNDIICGTEREYQELFLSWQRTSEEHEKSKTKTMEVLKALEYDIEEKNGRIYEYEAQILNVEQEVGDMFVMLKTSLSEIEFIDKQELNNDVDENLNIILQTKATVSNVNLLIKLLENERRELQKQLDDVKSEKKVESQFAVCDAGTYVNYESSTDFEETSKESEIEIQNQNLDENKTTTLNVISDNSENSQDYLESQVTDQESTIEIWDCSFDKKIDSVLERHVTSSILKIRRLTETFTDVEMEKLKKIKELKSEILKRDLEIEELRNQNIQWKGEGDFREREKINQEKRERELEEEIYSYKFKLFGVNQECSILKDEAQNLQEEKNLLLEKYKKAHEEIELRNQDLSTIEMHKQKVEETQSRFRNLQMENEKLKDDLLKVNKVIEEQNIKVQELLNEKQEIEEVLGKFEEQIRSKDYHIENLMNENEILGKLKSTNNRNFEELSLLKEQVKILCEEKGRLTNKNVALKSDFVNYQNKNVELEKEIENIMKENKNLTSCIDILKDQFDKVVSTEIENKISMKKVYSDKMMKNIALLREKYENKILEEKERKYLETKSRNSSKIDSSVAEDSSEKKSGILLVHKSTIVDSDLILSDGLNEKAKNHLENESRQKEDEILRLKYQLEEKNSEIKNIEEKHKHTLITVAKKKDEEIKNLKNHHDKKVKKLEDNFNSWTSDGFSFGTENWLKSLSIEELKVLCHRISSLLPLDELSKIMSTKQNKYLQQDLSEKKKLIDKVTELENHILKLNQRTLKVEELEQKLQQERCKSAGLQKRLSENKGPNDVNNKRLFTYDDGLSKEARFWQYISDQNHIKNRTTTEERILFTSVVQICDTSNILEAVVLDFFYSKPTSRKISLPENNRSGQQNI